MAKSVAESGCNGLTVSMTLSLDVTFTDLGTAAVMYFEHDHLLIEPFTNILPLLSDLVFSQEIDQNVLNLTYYDENGHFPLIYEFLANDGFSYPFFAQGNDFQQPVSYTLTLPPGNLIGTIRFSDNGYQFVEIPVQDAELAQPEVSAQVIDGVVYLDWEGVVGGILKTRH